MSACDVVIGGNFEVVECVCVFLLAWECDKRGEGSDTSLLLLIMFYDD